MVKKKYFCFPGTEHEKRILLVEDPAIIVNPSTENLQKFLCTFLKSFSWGYFIPDSWDLKKVYNMGILSIWSMFSFRVEKKKIFNLFGNPSGGRGHKLVTYLFLKTKEKFLNIKKKKNYCYSCYAKMSVQKVIFRLDGLKCLQKRCEFKSLGVELSNI